MHETAKAWITLFLISNGFRDDFTEAEIDEWAIDLIDTMGLPK